MVDNLYNISGWGCLGLCPSYKGLTDQGGYRCADLPILGQWGNNPIKSLKT